MVLGVSPDSARRHALFRARRKLPFRLLADTDHVVSSAYGVWREKRLFGHRFMGVVRTTFVIDREGRVARVFERVRSAGHGEAVAHALSVIG